MDVSTKAVVWVIVAVFYVVGSFFHAIRWISSLTIESYRQTWARRLGLITLTPRLCLLIALAVILAWPWFDFCLLIIWLAINKHWDRD